MNKTLKKTLSIILTILMIVTTVPFAFAADIVASGECGADNVNDVIWSLDSEGTLTISGTGKYAVEWFNAPWLAYKDSIKNVVIEEGITNIADTSFHYIDNALSLSIPSTVNEIDNCGNNEFAEFKLAEENISFTLVDGVLFNADKTELIMYPIKKAEETYTVPAGITTLKDYSFRSAKNLKTINISDDVTTIGSYCFEYSSLETVNFGANVDSIERGAFGYTRLKTVVLPEKLTEIPYALFYACDYLENLVIGSNVTSINRDVINYCDKLDAVHFTGTEEQWEAITKPADASDAINTIAVHCGTLEEKAGFAATCGVDGHTASLYCAECDTYFKGEVIPATGEHDWSNKDGICVKGCGGTCIHESHTDGKCDVCGYECSHENFTDGKCDVCKVARAEYTAFDAAVEELRVLLEREDLLDGPKQGYTSGLNGVLNGVGDNKIAAEQSIVNYGTQNINSMIDEIEAGIENGSMIKADFSYMTELFAEINELIGSDSGKIIPSQRGLYTGTLAYYNGCSNNPTFTQQNYNSNISYEKNLEALLAGLKDGSMLVADYTEIDEAIAEIEQKLTDENVTDEAKAGFEEIKSQLEEMKADVNTSEADLAELEKALEDCDADIDAGIEDGTAVKADYTAIDEAIAEIEQKLADENVTDEAKAGLEEIKSQLEEMKADVNTSEADLAELEKALEDCDADIDAGIENGTAVKADYTEIDEAIKDVDEALENATISDEMKAELEDIKADLETLKENENSTKADVSELLDRAEAITEVMDNCAADKHIDENEDNICDHCVKTLLCEDCGRPAHEGQINEYICLLITFIKLVVSLIRTITVVA